MCAGLEMASDAKPPAMATSVEVGPYRGKPPGAYIPGSDWRIWLKRFEIFLQLREVTQERIKRLVFLDEIGPDNYGLLETMFPGQELENVSYSELTGKMTERFRPKVLLHSERFRLLNLKQRKDQSLSEFYAEVQHAAKTCQLDKVTDVRDLFVSMAFLSGVTGDETRKRLLEQEDKPSSQLLEVAEAYQRACVGAQEVKHEVHRVSMREPRRNRESTSSHGSWRENGRREDRRKASRNEKWKERKNGSKRSYKEPSKCHGCGKIGHFIARCPRRSGRANWVEGTYDEREFEIHAVSHCKRKDRSYRPFARSKAKVRDDYCHICERCGHSTRECRYNGRVTGCVNSRSESTVVCC